MALSPIPEISVLVVSVLGFILFVGHLIYGYFDHIRKDYRVVQLNNSSYSAEHTIWFGTIYSKLRFETYETEQDALHFIQRHKERKSLISA